MECGTLWCVRGTVVRTLQLCRYSASALRCRVPLCEATRACTHTVARHVGVLGREGEAKRTGREEEAGRACGERGSKTEGGIAVRRQREMEGREKRED